MVKQLVKTFDHSMHLLPSAYGVVSLLIRKSNSFISRSEGKNGSPSRLVYDIMIRYEQIIGCCSDKYLLEKI